MNKTGSQGPQPESLNLKFNYKFFSWLLFSPVVLKLTLFDYLDSSSGADSADGQRSE
ncbi:hypothetical protein ALP10_02954 [Pseudomonas syringae pv. helianthi]|uniref:Uncharacterized protein n=1 Tax=Pseudomonas syringae pv. helianthi TaxID=251654 RepID=A0A3M4S620_9PSED|nr:hypothetical protein ALP93_03328 [Pseudomonas syringae pv. helianthi]RMV50593.1 hypothetical protein ALP10_02954 [Pseudomonas syringae pv. helianthi]